MSDNKTPVHIALTQGVGADGELSGLDKRLLEMAAEGMSANEMSAQLGIAPARAAQRVREILREKDFLSILEQEAIAIMELNRLKSFLWEVVERSGPHMETDEDGRDIVVLGDPRWAATLNKTIDSISRIVNGRRASNDLDRAKIRNSTAQLMYSAIELTFNNLLFQLRAEYPEVDELKIRNMVEDALPRAVAEIEARIIT